MNLADFRLEVRSRVNGPGYRFLSDTRLNRFINEARQTLDDMYLWPYREASTTGTAPLTIADLAHVEKVIDQSNSSAPLARVDYSTLVESFGDLSVGGSPAFYYVARPSGSPVVATYPTSSHTIGVQYWKVTSDLVADSDTPLAPAAWHSLITDMATQLALRANRHRVGRYLQFAEADSYTPAIQAQIQAMLFALPPGQQDGPDAYVGVSGASSDW